LVETVSALLRQEDAEQWKIEIVIVDDGSPASPEDALRKAGVLDSVRLEIRPHSGRGGARNALTPLAQGRWIVFLGADIVAEPGFIAAHARLLDESADGRRMSLGCVTRDMGKASLPLQTFAAAHVFDGFQPEETLDFRFFYTSNVALPRRALDEVGLFDESFTDGVMASYGWEDIDLGYRLEKAGWELVYNPDAMAEHRHGPPSVAELCRREEEIGYGGCAFYAKHMTPEAERAAFWPGTREAKAGPRWRIGLGRLAANALERLSPNSNLLSKVYGRLVFSSRCRGVEKGRAAFPQADI